MRIAAAEDARSATHSSPEVHGYNTEDNKELVAACLRGRQRAQELLVHGHYVDAHLVAQNLSFLCVEFSDESELLDAIALTHLEEYERAYTLLESIALSGSSFAKTARVLSAWSRIKGGFELASVNETLERPDAGRIEVFARVQKGLTLGTAINEISDQQRAMVLTGVDKLESVSTKRPWLAGTLSALVPGLGQAYSGSWQGAGISLFLNGLFLSATVELARKELYFAAATTGLAGSIFYIGNILNAVDLADRYNEGITEEPRRDLERILIPEAYLLE